MEIKYEVRQDKFMFVFVIVSACLLVTFLMGISIGMVISVILREDYTNDDRLVFSLAAVIAFAFALVFSLILAKIIYEYKNQVDIYTEEKLIRTMKGRVVFELPYSQIASVKIGWHVIFISCERAIIQANGKKGLRTIYEHYSEHDVQRVKQIISESKGYQRHL